MNKKHVIVGIIVIAILVIGLLLLLSNNKMNGNMAVPTQIPEPEIVTEAPIDNPTERITIRITNQPTATPTSVPPTPTPNPWKDTVVEPTCEEDGYIIHENLEEGITTILEGEQALGHDWSEWTEDANTGMMVSTCSRCGKEIQREEIYTGKIPRIDFTGSMDGISKADRVTLKFDYTSPDEVFSCYSYTTWQGHTTLKYPKKNYTIRLYDDEEIIQKHRVIFYGWQREHKYVLKANYRDISQMRNLIAAHLWAEMAASRPNLFNRLRATSNYGAVDGFPVIVYYNGEFLGLYTMNLHIDDDLYQMDNAYDAVMITNSTEPDETRFRALADFTDEKKAWEVEFCGTGENSQWAKDKLNELICFVMTSDDDEFRMHLKDYLDVDGAIDYLIYLYATGLQDNATKDLVLLKYHDCDIWIPSVYDMEHAFGLSRDGTEYLSPEVFFPMKENGVWESGTNSLLWDRVLNIFEEEIKRRYVALRESILTEDIIAELIVSYQIPEEYYQQDLERWGRTVPDMNPIEQIQYYFASRLKVLDNIFGKEVFFVTDNRGEGK